MSAFFFGKMKFGDNKIIRSESTENEHRCDFPFLK